MQLQENLHKLKQRIQTACSQAGRNPKDVTLLAVSKRHGTDKIESLHKLGLRNFAENYTQELLEKTSLLSHLDIRWSFIGRLQSNKIKKIVGNRSKRLFGFRRLYHGKAS